MIENIESGNMIKLRKYFLVLLAADNIINGYISIIYICVVTYSQI